LLRLEDYALLVGAIVSFAAVAAAMYITRNVDWYGTGGAAQSFTGAAATAPTSQKESWLD
jgi:inner membrane protein involved in colicin E2 resistance